MKYVTSVYRKRESPSGDTGVDVKFRICQVLTAHERSETLCVPPLKLDERSSNLSSRRAAIIDIGGQEAGKSEVCTWEAG